jgi:hypothetical protein
MDKAYVKIFSGVVPKLSKVHVAFKAFVIMFRTYSAQK